MIFRTNVKKVHLTLQLDLTYIKNTGQSNSSYYLRLFQFVENLYKR